MSGSILQSTHVRLEKPSDWPIWLSFVRVRAQSDDVWDRVDPSKLIRPTCVLKPIKPVEPPMKDGIIDLQQFEQFKAQQYLYKTRLADYNAQSEAFNRLILHIQATISATTAVYLENVDAHPYNLLRALKLRFAPTDEARKMRIEAKYHELCSGPANQDVEKFLDLWQQTYVEGKECNVSEMIGNRPIRDFIYSLMDFDEAWANAQLYVIDEEVKTDSLFKLISKFRNHQRLKRSRILHRATHTASPRHDASDQTDNPSPPSQTRENQPSSDASASTGFVASDDTTYHAVFTTASSDGIDYPLRSSWIYDGGAEGHVCNKTMLHRFRKTGDAPTIGLLAGEARSHVEAIGEVDITLDAPEGKKWKITLKDVRYIPNFMTNVIDPRKFRAKGVYFDDQHMRLHTRDGRTLGLVKLLHGHDVLEDNTTAYATANQPSDDKVSHPEGVKTDQHIESTPERVRTDQQLESVVEGVEITRNSEEALQFAANTAMPRARGEVINSEAPDHEGLKISEDSSPTTSGGGRRRTRRRKRTRDKRQGLNAPDTPNYGANEAFHSSFHTHLIDGQYDHNFEHRRIFPHGNFIQFTPTPTTLHEDVRSLKYRCYSELRRMGMRLTDWSNGPLWGYS